MNVFVTGGAGYIGSICTEELLNAGHQVTVYDNLSEGHRPAVDPRASLGRSASLNWRRHNLAPRHHAYLPRPDHRVPALCRELNQLVSSGCLRLNPDR